MARVGRLQERMQGRLTIVVLVLAVCGTIGYVTATSSTSSVGDVHREAGHGPAAANLCMNSDGSVCPPSYFTGPLGKKNLLPNETGAFLIEYYGDVGTSWDQMRLGIEQRQAYIGRKFDGLQIHYGGAGTWDGVFGMYSPVDYTPSSPLREQWIIDNGSFVAVSWTPDYTIGQMNNGAADEIWAKAANYWKSYAPNHIMLRSFAEFNLPQVGGAVPSALNGDVDYCGAPFVSAWQRMVRIFHQNGASNVGFWFTPDEGNNRQCIIDSYPGDSYVDWVGSDSYNRCLVDDASCHSSPLYSGWAEFVDLFGYSGICASGDTCKPSLHDLYGPRKPFIIGEVGTVFDTQHPSYKGNFYRSVVPGAKSMRYLRGVSLFDADVTALEGPMTNWRVDYPTSALGPYVGFKQMARDPWFDVG